MTTDELRGYLSQVPNLSAFARETGLAYSTLHQFKQGFRKTLKPLTHKALEKAIKKKDKPA